MSEQGPMEPTPESAQTIERFAEYGESGLPEMLADMGRRVQEIVPQIWGMSVTLTEGDGLFDKRRKSAARCRSRRSKAGQQRETRVCHDLSVSSRLGRLARGTALPGGRNGQHRCLLEACVSRARWRGRGVHRQRA